MGAPMLGCEPTRRMRWPNCAWNCTQKRTRVVRMLRCWVVSRRCWAPGSLARPARSRLSPLTELALPFMGLPEVDGGSLDELCCQSTCATSPHQPAYFTGS